MRVVLLQSWLSCRALFAWLNPIGYFSSLIVFPVAIGLIVAVYEPPGAVVTAVVGLAFLASANAVMYGVSQSLVNDKLLGTLPLVLCAPQNLLGSLLVRCVAHVISGLLSGVLSLLLLYVLLRPHMTGGDLAATVVMLAVVSLSMTGVGVCLAAIGIRLRDAMTAANAMRSVLLLGSGALLKPSSLPVDLTLVHDVLPIGHLRLDTTAVSRSVLSASGALVDLAVGACWLVVGALILNWSLVVLRRRAHLEFS